MDLINHTTMDMTLKLSEQTGINIFDLAMNDESFKRIVNDLLTEDHIDSLLTISSYKLRNMIVDMLMAYDKHTDGDNPYFKVEKR